MQEQNQGCSCCTSVSVNLAQISGLRTAGTCPACGHKGKKVDGATVKSMLAVSLQEVQDRQYLFCQQPDCDVVYFSEDGSQIFGTADVRERVYQKEPHAGDVFVCYCFRYTPDSIRQEIHETGTSTVVDDINTGITAGQCACDWRNPQGTCCLSNVRNVVKRFQIELGIFPGIDKKT